MHPNCRCSIAAYEDEEDFQKWLDKQAGYDSDSSKIDKLNNSSLNTGNDGIMNQTRTAVDDAKQLIDNMEMPDNYRQHLKATIDIADPEGIRLFNKYVQENSFVEENGAAYYLPADSRVHIDLAQAFEDPRKLRTTFFHEFGHFIDFHSHDGDLYTGRSTGSSKFGQLLREDFNDYVKAYQKKHEIEEETDVYEQIGSDLSAKIEKDPEHKLNGVSDIFGGLSRNQAKDGYGHDTSYWERSGAVEQEAFAHMYMSLFDPDKAAIMRKYFPKAYSKFKADLKGA